MNSRAFSVLGLFDSAQQLMDAIPSVKARVAGRLDAYTPFPIHGIEDTLGLRKSPIAGMVLVMGLIGAVAAIAFELWAGGVDYPIMTAGKPFFSWEAFVPIMFEVMVLFACFTAGLGMLLLLNRLPGFRHPMLRSGSMPLITRDKFALAVESDGQALDVRAISLVLRDAGAGTVEIIEENAAPGPVSPRFLLRILAGIAISCVAAGYLTYWGVKLFPVFPPMVHMLDQPRLDAQRESGFFKDGSGMRPPVSGTVARGRLPYTLANQDDAAALANPLPRTAGNLRQGKHAFMTYCSVCHGILGDGVATLTAAYGAKPANLVAQKIREYSDGAIYHVVRAGKNTMPSYEAELNEDERWAAVHYVRVLQRALNARDTDIPKETAK
jgi:mono/diheme cytochrome c family protein